MSDIANPKIQIEDVTYTYEGQEALRHISAGRAGQCRDCLPWASRQWEVHLLRLINRLNDLIDGTSMTGRILMMERMSIRGTSTWLVCDAGWEWCSRCHCHCSHRKRNILYGPKLAGCVTGPSSKRSWCAACHKRRCGTR